MAGHTLLDDQAETCPVHTADALENDRGTIQKRRGLFTRDRECKDAPRTAHSHTHTTLLHHFCSRGCTRVLPVLHHDLLLLQPDDVCCIQCAQ